SLLVGDFNGDGMLDLMYIDNRGGSGFQITYLQGNCDNGPFNPPVTVATVDANVSSMVAADVNGDGKLDLILSDLGPGAYGIGTGGAYVLLGNGDGTFQPLVRYAPGL